MSKANERMVNLTRGFSHNVATDMSSHRVHFFHVIWSTKGRVKNILPKVKDQLYPYLNGIIKRCGGYVLAIGGMPDHVHILLEISNLDHFTSTIRSAKAGSSAWLKDEFTECKEFAWQSGYGSFSISYSQLDAVKKYINNQEQHHEKVSFEDEYKKILALHNAKFDQKYLFD